MTPAEQAERARLVESEDSAWRKFAFGNNMNNQYLWAWQDEHRYAVAALAAFDAAHKGEG